MITPQIQTHVFSAIYRALLGPHHPIYNDWDYPRARPTLVYISIHPPFVAPPVAWCETSFSCWAACCSLTSAVFFWRVKKNGDRHHVSQQTTHTRSKKSSRRRALRLQQMQNRWSIDTVGQHLVPPSNLKKLLRKPEKWSCGPWN